MLIDLRRRAVRPAGEELGAGQARQPGHHQEEREAPHRRLPRRRLHADAAARPGRRHHALADLLLVPDPAGRHHDPRDQPPAAREPEVPPRRSLPGLLVRRRRSPAWRCSSASSGPSCAATSSGPTASASRPSPSTRSSSACFSRCRSPASSPRPSASPRRATRRSRSGRSSATRWRCSSRATTHLAGWHQALWILHVLTFFAFLVILPVTMLRHMFTSPLNMYLKDRDRPKGAMKPMPNLMETELESFGASTIEDFTWKQLLDTDACTMCGRCTSVCPAHATGKPLDPREIVLKTGEVMAATGDPAGVAADRRRRRDHHRRRLRLRAHHRRGGLGLHHLQGLRRDLPGQHRDPRQDPRHAALPVAHGVRTSRPSWATPTGRWRTPATRGA